MQYAILEAAVSCGSPFNGSEKAYQALLTAGLAERLVSCASESGCTLYPMEPLRTKNADFPDDLLHLKECLEASEKLRSGVISALQAGQFPIVIGGDHSVAMGSLAALSETYGADNLALIYIDAHADCNTEKTSESHRIHGMDLAEAMGLTDERLRVGKNRVDLLGSNLYLLGTRSVDAGEWPILREQGAHVYTDETIHDRGLQTVLAEILPQLAGKKVAVSFDVDVLSPETFWATGYNIPGGLTPEEVKAALRTLTENARTAASAEQKPFELVSLECVEYNPDKDADGRDAKTVLELLEVLK